MTRSPHLPPHTSAAYQAEMRELKERLLMMAGRCERLIAAAVDALVEQNEALARSTTEADREINADEVAVDELAVRILALRHPMGRDLREVLATIKVVTDLERIGDEAVNIAQRATELCQTALPAPSFDLPRMEKLTTAMLRDALDAFVDEDAEKARLVLERDDAVDDLYRQIRKDCVALMAREPERIESAMSIASCAKYLERVADHATNVAEMVVYLALGEDVRHQGKR